MAEFLEVFLRGLTSLPGAIEGVEALSGLKAGEDKKTAALELVKAALNVTNAVEEKNIVDAEGFSSGLGTIVDGVVACLNASLWHAVSKS